MLRIQSDIDGSKVLPQSLQKSSSLFLGGTENNIEGFELV